MGAQIRRPRELKRANIATERFLMTLFFMTVFRLLIAKRHVTLRTFERSKSLVNLMYVFEQIGLCFKLHAALIAYLHAFPRRFTSFGR
jgi:hypothetical protein